MIEVNPDALDIAAALDGERGNGGARGALHGIPFLVKDVSIYANKRGLESMALLDAKFK